MEKTYVFNQDGAGGASNGLLASILPSLQNRGIDTGYLMGLMNGGGGNGGFFGNNGGFQDIIVLIVIAAIFGNGNFGFGGNNNQGANEGRDMIMQMLNRNGVDIASLAQALNLSSDQILAGINSVSQAICRSRQSDGTEYQQYHYCNYAGQSIYLCSISRLLLQNADCD